jgi:hypothetical protein
LITHQKIERPIFNATNTLNLQRLKFIFLLACSAKLLIFLYAPTPFDVFIKAGVQDALERQWIQHQAKGLYPYIFGGFHFIGAIAAYLLACRSKKIISRLSFFLISIYFAAWYFSKSQICIPFLTWICYKKKFFIAPFVVAALIFSVFYTRNLDKDLINNLQEIHRRFFTEIGYSKIHYKLYKNENPPLFLESRYFFGLNTLFGIKPKVKVNYDAYEIITNKMDSGTTTSGYAPVYLFGFFGNAVYLVLPILLFLIFLIDLKIYRKVINCNSTYVFYLFSSIFLANSITVDLFRLWHPYFLFSYFIYLAFFLFLFLFNTKLKIIKPKRIRIENPKS